MKFAFFTLGCKVNLFETQALEQLAQARGHEIVDRDADAVIINTCTVTSVSDHKNIRAFHRLRKDNPRAVIAACGCFAQTDPERVRATGEIDLVCGTGNRAEALALCEAVVEGRAVSCRAPERGSYEVLPAGVPRGRTRALLKIEDGCNNFCTYCIIPYARGRVRSLPPAQAAQEAARLEQQGVHEIVLTGIEIASYGRDLQPAVSLTDLLCDLLPAHPGIRFRLGSLDPRVVDADFCSRLMGLPNLARHFHLSLQSGCDSVLQRMGRKYTAEEYYQAVEKIRAAVPDASIATDLIVGFPGETEEEFETTLAFLEHCAFAAVHVFPFSVREGTRAASLPGQLSSQEKAVRAERAKAVALRLSEAYRRSFVGKELTVLPEHHTGKFWAAHGTYGFPVYIEEEERIEKNGPVSVQLEHLHRDGLRGKIL
ncbi:tRNA (N(6)-L-threonylcarbamoyladenosine(37)-C(2))-methylthiotransferase MtaB [Candidatus Agathobaculum pullicola]|uniref:tRNA (N(6)-L-threonylcarbamoyladenosine(37)-C(2))- methylthiotransferase MtaB n=1 Tax=Candidatus Agathobaculum pullicola TaxID=2838426 RepID=UPI003F90BD4D